MTEQERREWLRQSFDYCCGYCGVREDECGGELEEDHYQPRSQGGTDAFENLVYCCPTCNRLKGDFWNTDPVSPRRILHPRRDNLTLHLREESDGRLTALTEAGVFHIYRLRLNRPQLIAMRLRRWQQTMMRQESEQLRNTLRQLLLQQEHLIALMRQALEGDEEAMQQLREVLDRSEP